jgi:hypothetical protein
VVVFRQLEPAVAVGRAHHRDLAADVVEPDRLVGEVALDVCATLEAHAERGEERDRRVQVVDDDGDVVHALDGHGSTLPRSVRDAKQ